MNILSAATRKIIAGGILFIIPLAVLFMLIERILKIIRPLSETIEPVFGKHSILGITSVTIIGFVLFILLCYISGLLIHKGLISFWGPRMELALFRLFPALQMFKFMHLPEEELKPMPWKPFLLSEGDYKRIAFVTDDSQDDYVAIFIPDAPHMDAGEVRYVPRKGFEAEFIPVKAAFSAIHNYGNGLNIS